MEIKLSEQKLVSVILCFYNEEKYIKGAIESVLAQTYKNFELILVSDGSTDRSEEIVDSFNDERIKRVYCKENGGLSRARNIGYEYASGDYIVNFDADDLLMPEKLEKQVAYMETHTDILVVSGGYYYMDQNGVVEKEPIIPKYTDSLDLRAIELFENRITNAGASLCRSEIFKHYDIRNDESMFWCEDYHLWHQIFKIGNIEMMPEPFFYYRVNHGSVTNRRRSEKYGQYIDALTRLYKFAWASRGIVLKDKDISFLVDKYHERKEVKLYEVPYMRNLYNRIRKQVVAQNLAEGEKILELYLSLPRKENIKKIARKIIKKVRKNNG